MYTHLTLKQSSIYIYICNVHVMLKKSLLYNM